MILPTTIRGRIAVPKSSKETVFVTSARLEDVNISESADGQVVICGGAMLI